MTDMILHHYETSPYAEKVRLGLGLKGLAWASVEIPVIMPKPDLTALTGGYRKTPVLQIGADLYCDSQLIMRELERRHPSPRPLFPFSPSSCRIEAVAIISRTGVQGSQQKASGQPRSCGAGASRCRETYLDH